MDQIEIYYQSIKETLERINEWRPPPPTALQRLIDIVAVVTGIAFALSVIPLLPTLLIIVSGILPVQIGPIDTTTGTFVSFGLLWLGLVILTALLFFPALWLNSKIDESHKPPKPPQTLSPDQVSFIYLFQAYKELSVFFVSHIDQHVDNATRALEAAFSDWRFAIRHSPNDEDLDSSPALAAELYPSRSQDLDIPYAFAMMEAKGGYRPISSLPALIGTAKEILRATERYPWLELDASTHGLLASFLAFPQKVMPRLRARQDLPAIHAILEDASKLSYAYLPEHQTYLDSDSLSSLRASGELSLESFVARISAMAHYTVEPPTTEKLAESTKARSVSRLARAYGSSLLMRFAAWFLLLAALTGFTLLALSRFIKLTPDAVATIVISASVAGAAALAAILPQPKHPA